MGRREKRRKRENMKRKKKKMEIGRRGESKKRKI